MIKTIFSDSNFDYKKRSAEYTNATPFNYMVIDNFLETILARNISNEFPDFSSEDWRKYNNQIEQKKLLNHWDKFPPLTYELLTYLNSQSFIDKISKLTGISNLYPDMGLNGGGWHIHSSGGKLNVHRDYVIHPKLGLMRILNLIIYLTEDWNPNWGGGLGLWSHDNSKNLPGNLIQEVEFRFNRAILFNTTQNSWHGLPDPIVCPPEAYRKSIAVYYLTDPIADCERRSKALFAPYKEQVNDPHVLELIKKRSNAQLASCVYEK
jgi:Rps23 Pro-64 3,4-dihydroxylase Tpa1-like proline 4-hydroxylase